MLFLLCFPLVEVGVEDAFDHAGPCRDVDLDAPAFVDAGEQVFGHAHGDVGSAFFFGFACAEHIVPSDSFFILHIILDSATYNQAIRMYAYFKAAFFIAEDACPGSRAGECNS